MKLIISLDHLQHKWYLNQPINVDSAFTTSQIMRNITRFYIHLRYFAAAVFGIWGLYSLSTGNTDVAKVLIFIALIGLSSSVFMRSKLRENKFDQ